MGEEDKEDGEGEGSAGEERRSRRRRRRSLSRSLGDNHSGLSRSTLLLIFFSGAVVALCSHLLTQHLHSLRESQEARTQRAYLPDGSHLAVVEEEQPAGHFQSFSTKELRKRESSQLQTYRECEPEALKALGAARKSKTPEKARRLYEHALSLCPKHPKVLVHYGEFLEELGNDVVEADHMYSKAIAFATAGSEEHTRAMLNKRKMAGMVEEHDTQVFKRLDEKKRLFQKLSEGSSSMRRAKKEAYFQHVFHTVGIEGNTLSLSQTRFVLETRLAISGKSIVEHNEVVGLDAALRYVNQTLVDKVGEVTLEDVLEIHRRVIGHVDPLSAATVRQTQVFVSDHVPPRASDVELLLRKFFIWLNSPDRSSLHAVQLAALAHYKFVHIHPFADGNGRTSRLLMNLVLMQSGFPPVIIRKQDRLEYFRHLSSANEGDVRPFVRFVAECTERTLDAFIAAGTENPATKHFSGLMPFVDEAETTITAQDRLDYHNAIIMGGLVGENMTVEP